MKRRLEFRAWDKKNKRILKNCYLGKVEIYYENNEYDAGNVLMSNCEIMQFTGLLDRNGKEIYEGDIVKCHKCDGQIYCILWNEYHTGWGFIKSEAEGFEIIGNAYENPELLKGGSHDVKEVTPREEEGNT